MSESRWIKPAMWGLSCYFNPLGWRSRRQAFETFRQSLRIPLVVVEWSPTARFELQSEKGFQVLQVSGGSILWQKERLLNMGIQALPDECTHVTFMDADLIFEDFDWPEQAMSALETHRILQPFSEVCHLPPAIQSRSFLDMDEEPAYTSRCQGLAKKIQLSADPSTAITQIINNQSQRFKHLLDQQADDSQTRSLEDQNTFESLSIPTPGLAWSCRRDTLEKLGGMPDRFIGGGGDLFLLLGLLGRGQDLVASCGEAGLTYIDHEAYRSFCHAQSDQPHSLGSLPQRIFHLHHGSLSNRRYDSRHVTLQHLGIDLDRDLGLDGTGLLCFQGPAKEKLEQHMHQYFLARMDDELTPGLDTHPQQH